MSWLTPVREALAEATSPVTFFFRDDDAGWADERLWCLLDVMSAATAPVDLAVIPAALSGETATELLARQARSPELLGLHQHGYRHENHEPNGRPCEFGPSQSKAVQRQDIAEGAALLGHLLPGVVDPIFTPPWNRCTPLTGACVAELGMRALSRETRAEPLRISGLLELPILVDWLKRAGDERLPPAAVADLVGGAVREGHTVGVMFHHAAMDDDELVRVAELLALLGTSPAARCRPMREILEEM